jgi:hypothetical protein
MNRELIMNQRLTRIIMHLDEKTILFSLVELTDHLRAVVTETKVNCITIAGGAQRWRRWPHFAIAAGLRGQVATPLEVGAAGNSPARVSPPHTHAWARATGLCSSGCAVADRRGAKPRIVGGGWPARCWGGRLGSGKRYYGAVEVSRSQLRKGTPSPRCGKALAAAPRRRAYQGPPRPVAPAG